MLSAQRTQAIKELLADPSFDPQPYFGDAVISLTNSVLPHILRNHPHFLKYFLVEGCETLLGDHLQFDDDELTIEVLRHLRRSFGYTNDYPTIYVMGCATSASGIERAHATLRILERAPANKFDLITRHVDASGINCKWFVRKCNPDQLTNLALNHHPDAWYIEDPSHEERAIIGAHIAYYCNYEGVMHLSDSKWGETAMAVATRVKLRDCKKILEKFQECFKEFYCYKCKGFSSSSASGAVNHFRSCDQDNYYPNPIRLLKRRMEEKVPHDELALKFLAR